mmetsp:Transcript_13479/g.23605  ORF Transcript_13479/g.23605 Transcript_13479/m.23605 type:complete len:84 (-) Transcript_13479:188-439(-)
MSAALRSRSIPNASRPFLLLRPPPCPISVWELSDIDKDGMLDMDEFSVAMYLCRQSQSGFPMPAELPADVVPPSKRYLAANPF